MSHPLTDKNLLFGVIALQSDLIDMRKVVDGCTLWASRKNSTRANILVQQGWPIEADREPVEYLLQRRMKPFPAFRPQHPAHVARCFAAPEFQPMASGATALELHDQRKDGSIFPAEISLRPIRTEQGLLVSAAVRDLSQREYRLLNTER